jgi:hypothetical protein
MFNGNPIVHIYPTAAGQPSVSISMHYTSTSKPYAVDAILKMNTVTMPARTFVFSVALICVPVAAVTINLLSELRSKGVLGCHDSQRPHSRPRYPL